MTGHDDDAAPFGKQPFKKLVGLGRVLEQVWCVWCSESAKEIDAVVCVGSEGCEPPALQGLVALFAGKIARRLSAMAARHARINLHAIHVPIVPIAYETARGSVRTP